MKKVLFITYDFPYPTNTGGKNRAYHMLKESKNSKKYLFSFIRDDFKSEYEKKIEELGIEVVAKIKRKKTNDIRIFLQILKGHSIFKALYFEQEVLEKIISIISDKKIDIVHFESYYTGFYISDRIKELGVAQIFGTENIEYTLYDNYSKNLNPFFRRIIKNHVAKIKKEEEEMYKKADLCLAVSKSDQSIVKSFSNCEIIENGVDTAEFIFNQSKNKTGKKLLFVGNFSYFPNTDAINYFYEEVFKDLPNDFKLLIIGKKGKSLKFIDDNRVEVREFVENIADVYHEADIMVAPVRIGGGTNFKILEAMASGIPVVALPQRLVGLEVENNKDIVVVQNSLEFRSQIVLLAKDVGKRERLTDQARKTVEEKYSWGKIGEKLTNIWEKL